eukprot:12208807-Alexandrium_andersonii.AAC.1
MTQSGFSLVSLLRPTHSESLASKSTFPRASWVTPRPMLRKTSVQMWPKVNPGTLNRGQMLPAFCL